MPHCSNVHPFPQLPEDDDVTDQGAPPRLLEEAGNGVLFDDGEVVPLVFTRPPRRTPESAMSKLAPTVETLKGIDGYIACGVVDAESGMALIHHSADPTFPIEAACAANTEVVKAKHRAMKALKLSGGIDDIMITLSGQYHLIRPLKARPTIFIYLAIDRSKANMAMARFTLADCEKSINL